MFQDRQEKEASNEVFELSEGISLNEPLVTQLEHQMKLKNRTQILNQSQNQSQGELQILGHQQLHQMEWDPCWQIHRFD